MDSIQATYHAPVRRTLSAAVVISLLLHAGAAGLLSWTGTHDLSATASAGQISQLDAFQAFKSPEPEPTPEPPKPEPPKVEEVKPPPAPPEMEQERVRLGIDESSAKTETWKGSAKATEHSAAKSEVDQPALAISPGAPGPSDPGISDTGAAASQAAMMGPPAPSETVETPASAEQAATPETAEAQPKPMQLEPRQDQAIQPEPKQPLPLQPEAQQVEPKQPIPAPAGTGALEMGPVQDKDIQPLPEQPKPLQEKDQQLKPVQPRDVQTHPVIEEPKEPMPAQEPRDAPKEQPKDKTTPQQAASGQAAQGAPGVRANSPDAQPGQKAEEESAAASVTESLVYRPGQPLAGKGLKVNTVTPRYGVTTQLTTSPKNTVIRITFGRNGKVIRAVFMDSGTGFEDVDGPLLDAVYRWTAKGEVLEKIPADKPQAGLNFDIKFLMHGGR
jgi:hypothetical protein